MDKTNTKKLTHDLAFALLVVFCIVLILAASWGIVLLLSWLIALCFGLEWTLLFGTGVWLCCVLIRLTVFNKDSE